MSDPTPGTSTSADASVSIPPTASSSKSPSGTLKKIFRSSSREKASKEGSGKKDERKDEDKEEEEEEEDWDGRMVRSREYDHYVDRAGQDPLGRMFLMLMKDNQELTNKLKIRSSLNIGEMCKDFIQSTEYKEEELLRKFAESEASLERKMLEKELNSTTLDHGIEPPTTFSSHSTLRNWEHRKEAQKLFPIQNKFSGAVGKDGQTGVTIFEYLSSMNKAQQHCCLSEPEFMDFLLATTTGKAHSLLSEWIEQNESLKDIYHSLLLNFDRRTTPEDAKASLASFKIRKNSTLSKAAGIIQNLAMRSSCTLPVGKSRTDLFNMDAINALIKSLPPASSTQALNSYHKLSSQLSRACTFTELVKSLGIYRSTIDADIRQHGAENDTKEKAEGYKGKNGGKGKKGKQQNTTYAVQAKVNEEQSVSQVSTYSVQTNTGNTNPNNGRGGSSANNQSGQTNQQHSQNNQQFVSPNYRGKNPRGRGGRWNNTNSYNQGQGQNHGGQGQPSLDYCSLCGSINHRASSGCPNMTNQSGNVIRINPVQGTCPDCPTAVSPRLNHPPAMCPFRPGGPFSR